jgi:hypothetical protein
VGSAKAFICGARIPKIGSYRSNWNIKWHQEALPVFAVPVRRLILREHGAGRPRARYKKKRSTGRRSGTQRSALTGATGNPRGTKKFFVFALLRLNREQWWNQRSCLDSTWTTRKTLSWRFKTRWVPPPRRTIQEGQDNCCERDHCC